MSASPAPKVHHDARASVLRGKILPTLDRSVLRPDPVYTPFSLIVANREESCPLHRMYVRVSLSNLEWVKRGESDEVAPVGGRRSN
jgi:hypothetical protein